MKKFSNFSTVLSVIVFTLMLSGCASFQGLTKNYNGHNTEVQLNRKNFKIVQKVEGSAQATYILGIGGLGKKALIARATEKMLADANLIGSSRAVINETVEIKNSFFLIATTTQINVSAYVIEFTE